MSQGADDNPNDMTNDQHFSAPLHPIKHRGAHTPLCRHFFDQVRPQSSTAAAAFLLLFSRTSFLLYFILFHFIFYIPPFSYSFLFIFSRSKGQTKKESAEINTPWRIDRRSRDRIRFDLWTRLLRQLDIDIYQHDKCQPLSLSPCQLFHTTPSATTTRFMNHSRDSHHSRR